MDDYERAKYLLYRAIKLDRRLYYEKEKI